MSEVFVPEQDSSRYVVRYGTMRLLGDFEARRQVSFARNDEVVVRSERGIEWGVILCPATQQTSSYLGNSKATGGRILWRAIANRRTVSPSGE